MRNALVSGLYFDIVKFDTEIDNKASFEAKYFPSQRNTDPKHTGHKLGDTQITTTTKKRVKMNIANANEG